MIYVSTSVDPDDLALVIVDVDVASLDGTNPTDTTFQGDTISQTGNAYYIDSSSGKQLYQIPAAINLAILDTGNGNQVGTYCTQDSAGDWLPCGGDYVSPGTPSNPPSITPSGIIQYAAWFSPLDEIYAPNQSSESGSFVACPSGPNITLSPAGCDTTTSLWKVGNNTINNNSGIFTNHYSTTTLGGGSSAGVLLSLPLPAGYVAPSTTQPNSVTPPVSCSSPQVPNGKGGCEDCPGNATPVNGQCPVVLDSGQTAPDNGCGAQPTVRTSIDFGCRGDTCVNPNIAGYNPNSAFCSSYENPVLDALFSILQFLSDGVGVLVVASIIVGGIQFTLSRDNPEAAMKARSRIQTSLVALIIFIFAYAILNYLIPDGFFK